MPIYQDLEQINRNSVIRESFEFRSLCFFLLWIFLEVLNLYDLGVPLGNIIVKIDLKLWPIRALCFIEIFLFIPYFAAVKKYPEKESQIIFLLACVDTVIFTCIIHYLGGIQTNFLPFFYLFFIAYAGAIFSKREIYMISIMCALCYITLFWFEFFQLMPSKLSNYGDLKAFHYYLRLGIVLFFIGIGGFISGVVAEINSEKKSLIHLGAFFSGLSHELRNPLAIIRNEIALLKKEYQSNHLFIVDNQTERIASLVDDVLSYSGEQKPKMRNIDLIGVVDNSCNYVMKSLPNREVGNINIVKEYTDDKIHIQGDNVQLQQSIINIIKNSIEGMNYHGMLKIKVSMFNVFWALVSIEDNGVGMTEAVLEKAFDPFLPTKGGNKGTGLGLAIAKRIIEDHGGTVSVVRGDKKGTTFVIKLPI